MFARIIKRSCVTSSRLCIRPSIQCSHASKQFYQSSSILLKDDDGAKKAARNLTDSLRKLLEDADHPQIEQLKSDNNGKKDDFPTTISSLVAKATKKESKLPQFDNYVNGINAFLESEWSHDTFHMSLVDPPIRSNVDQFGGLHHWSNQLYMGYEPRAVVVLQRDIEYSYRIAVIDWKNQEMSVIEHIFPEGLQELQEDIANAQPGDLDDFPTLDSLILNDAQSRLVQQLDYAALDQPDRYDHTTRSVINRLQLAYRNKILPYTKLKVPISREWLTALRKVRWPAVELELRRANFPGVGDPIFDTCLSFGQMGAEATRLVNYSQFADKNLTAGH